MTDDQHGSILRAVRAVREDVKDELKDLKSDVKYIRANQDLLRSEVAEHSKTIGVIDERCATRGKRLSELTRTVNGMRNEFSSDMNTQEIRLAKLDAHKEAYKRVGLVVGGVLSGVGAIAGLVFGLIKLFGGG